MATRALEKLNDAMVMTYTVVALGTGATAGRCVMFSGADTTVDVDTAITDLPIGIALNTAAAGAAVRVALWGAGIAKGKVGTGGATRGRALKWVADGLTNATIGGGTGACWMCGQAMQSGVATDLIGVNLAAAGPCVGS